MVPGGVEETRRDRSQDVSSHQGQTKPRRHGKAGDRACRFHPSAHRRPNRRSRRCLAAKLDCLPSQKFFHCLGAGVLRKLNRVDQPVS